MARALGVCSLPPVCESAASSKYSASCRPDTRRVDADIDAANLTDFRRLKRIRLTELPAFRFWPRSPSPEDEPLLRDDADAAADGGDGGAKNGEAGAGGGAQPRADPAAAALEQAELALFMGWLRERKAEVAAEQSAAATAEAAARLVGPRLPAAAADGGAADGDYGGNLRPGEGSRMAAFAKAGERIPRRGEIGMSAEEIEMFEQTGYVMSGNRHARMNAIRMRKENQVYTAEEKAALALMHQEEARAKEEALVAEMKGMVAAAVANLDAAEPPP